MNSLQELRHGIAAHCTAPSTPTSIPGLTLLRSFTRTAAPVQVIYTPMICVIAQGRKRVLLAGKMLEYDAAKYLISSVHLPVRGLISEASSQHPYLALSLALDQELLTSLTLDQPLDRTRRTLHPALAVTEINGDLLEAFVRLLRLLDHPSDIAALAPLAIREIHYRLLCGDRRVMLQQISMHGSRTRQVVRAIDWIRRHYARPFRMRELLDVANMSAPSLHRHFKALTAMTPLQYQKQIRLSEARRLLASRQQDAASVGFSVGYGSPSQFSREYARQFGAPPRQHAAHILFAEETLAS